MFSTFLLCLPRELEDAQVIILSHNYYVETIDFLFMRKHARNIEMLASLAKNAPSSFDPLIELRVLPSCEYSLT